MSEEPTHRQLAVDTGPRERMEAAADRIINRDKEFHTGGTGMVAAIEDVHGTLRHPFKRKRAR